jgi:hypothetical protein
MTQVIAFQKVELTRFPFLLKTIQIKQKKHPKMNRVLSKF